jgi:hypothetical protein
MKGRKEGNEGKRVKERRPNKTGIEKGIYM